MVPHVFVVFISQAGPYIRTQSMTHVDALLKAACILLLLQQAASASNVANSCVCQAGLFKPASAACVCQEKSYEIQYAGKFYGTLDKGEPNDYGWKACQNKVFLPLPEGAIIAPSTDAIRANVVAKSRWGTTCLLLADGKAVMGAYYGVHAGNGCANPRINYLLTKGNTYATSSCDLRIIYERPVPPPPPPPTTATTTATTTTTTTATTSSTTATFTTTTVLALNASCTPQDDRCDAQGGLLCNVEHNKCQVTVPAFLQAEVDRLINDAVDSAEAAKDRVIAALTATLDEKEIAIMAVGANLAVCSSKLEARRLVRLANVAEDLAALATAKCCQKQPCKPIRALGKRTLPTATVGLHRNAALLCSESSMSLRCAQFFAITAPQICCSRLLHRGRAKSM